MAHERIREHLELMADYVRYKFGCFTLPTNLEKIAKGLGVSEIAYEPMAAEGCVENTDGKITVRIRSNAPRVRKRFSLAHEIGHILLHKLEDKPDTTQYKEFRSYARVSRDEDVETIVDDIAGLLLMPSSFLRRRLAEGVTTENISRLADQAQVSLATALIRSVDVLTEPCVAYLIQTTGTRATCVKWVRASKSAAHATARGEFDDEIFMSRIMEAKAGEVLQNNLTWRSYGNVKRTFEDIESIYGLARVGEKTSTLFD